MIISTMSQIITQTKYCEVNDTNFTKLIADNQIGDKIARKKIAEKNFLSADEKHGKYNKYNFEEKEEINFKLDANIRTNKERLLDQHEEKKTERDHGKNGFKKIVRNGEEIQDEHEVQNIDEKRRYVKDEQYNDNSNHIISIMRRLDLVEFQEKRARLEHYFAGVFNILFRHSKSNFIRNCGSILQS